MYFLCHEAVSLLLAVNAACSDFDFSGSSDDVGSVSDLFSEFESCLDFDGDSSVVHSVVCSSDGSVFDSSSDLCESCSAIFGFYLSCT